MYKAKSKFNMWFIITIFIFISYAIFLLFPLFRLLKESFTYDGQSFSLGYFKKFFSEKYFYSSLLNSLKVTFCVTLASSLIAIPLAYVMSTYKIKGQLQMQILILISSMSPPFIGAYSWILLLGRSGVITKFLKSHGISSPNIYGFTGILIVLTLQLVPLIYMYLMGAMKNIDKSLLEASENLGCTGIKRVFKVIIPLILPTLLAGALLVFMRALADFGTPMLIGEGFQTVPVMIFNQFIGEMGGDSGFAAAISVIVIVFAISVFLLQRFITNKMAFSTSALSPIEPIKYKGLKNILAHLFIYSYVGLSLIPQLYVIYTSFLNTRGKIFVDGYSLNSYKTAFDTLGISIFNTFRLSLTALFIIFVIGVLIAYITVKKANAISFGLDIVSMLPYIVPGSVLGIALILAFSKKPLLLTGTAIIMIMSFVIRRLPYTIRSSAAILYQISPSIEEAAESLGASSFKTFFKITLPMMKSGILSGLILSFISIITELSTSILLYNANTKTMTVSIYTQVLRGNYGIAAALATILIALTVGALMIFFKVTGSKEISM